MIVYKYAFDVASLIVFIVLAELYRINFKSVRRINVRYEGFVRLGVAFCIVDIVAVYTVSYSTMLPLWVNYAINETYYGLLAIMGVFYFQFITYSTGYEFSIITVILDIYIGGFIILLATNPFYKLLFYFDENKNYVHGPLFYYSSITAYVFMAAGLFILFKNRKRYESRNLSAHTMLYVTYLITVASTIRNSNVMIISFGMSMSALIFLFAFESPDYIKLTRAQKQLAEATKELEAAEAVATKAEKSKREQITSVTDNASSQINKILANVRRIENIASKDEDRKIAEEMEDEAERFLEGTEEIRDYFKIQLGELELQEYVYNPKTQFLDGIKIQKRRIENKGLKLKISVDEKLPDKLLGDAGKITEVINNLLGMTLEETETGTVSLTIMGQPLETKYKLFVEIEDTGRGIKESEIPKLFKDFDQIGNENSKVIEGQGLLMSMADKLLGLMNSTIDIRSIEGVGTVYSFAVDQKPGNLGEGGLL